MHFAVLVLLLTFIGGSLGSGKSSWGYGKTQGKVYGPKDWGHVSEYCDGKSQSPVDIQTSGVRRGRDEDRPLRVNFAYRSAGYTMGKMTNNGHSPTFDVEKGGATLKNPINGQTYKLAQFHFHFGCDDSVGSEHTINGKSYPGELHLVFFNTKYGEIGAAASKPDGLSVIGVFLKKTSYYWGVSRDLRRIAYKMAAVSKEGATTTPFGVYLRALVPGLATGKREYYSYKGSLTTPGCFESVSWLVLKEPIYTSKHILQRFRRLKAKHGYKHGMMCNNFRPTLPLNGRKITLNGDD